MSGAAFWRCYQSVPATDALNHATERHHIPQVWHSPIVEGSGSFSSHPAQLVCMGNSQFQKRLAILMISSSWMVILFSSLDVPSASVCCIIVAEQPQNSQGLTVLGNGV
jgi:hypothetical protein